MHAACVVSVSSFTDLVPSPAHLPFPSRHLTFENMSRDLAQFFDIVATGSYSALQELFLRDAGALASLTGTSPHVAMSTMWPQVRSDLLFKTRYNGFSPAETAVIYDHAPILDLFWELSPVPFTTMPDPRTGWTLLHHAVHRGALNAIRWLVRHVPELCGVRDNMGRTPLGLLISPASRQNELFPGEAPPFEVIDRPEYADFPRLAHIAEILLSADQQAASAQLETRDSQNRTPLLMAVHYRRPTIALLLLQHGADVHARQATGKQTAGEKIRALTGKQWRSKTIFGGPTKDPVLEACVSQMVILCLQGGVRPDASLERAGTGSSTRFDDTWNYRANGTSTYNNNNSFNSTREDSDAYSFYSTASRSTSPLPPPPVSRPTNNTQPPPQQQVEQPPLPEELDEVIEAAISMELPDLDRVVETIRAMLLDNEPAEITIESVLDRMEFGPANGGPGLEIHSVGSSRAGSPELPPNVPGSLPRPDRANSTHSSRPSSAQSSRTGSGAGSVVEEKYCVICISEPPNVALLPCGHMVICQTCNASRAVKQGDLCPVCRKRVESVNRIYT